jgi:membrane protein
MPDPVRGTPSSQVGAQNPHDPRDESVGDLVKQLSEQTSTLVRQEMRLAQAELQEKGKRAGIGAGMFGASGLVAFFGAATLIAAAILALATAVDPWLAAVIVGVVLLAVAGVAALMGKKQVEQATPPAPEQAIDSVKRDVQTVKEGARR